MASPERGFGQLRLSRQYALPPKQVIDACFCHCSVLLGFSPSPAFQSCLVPSVPRSSFRSAPFSLHSSFSHRMIYTRLLRHSANFKDMPHSFWTTTNKAHGRLEIRRCWTLSDPRAFEVIRHYDGWAGLQS